MPYILLSSSNFYCFIIEYSEKSHVFLDLEQLFEIMRLPSVSARDTLLNEREACREQPSGLLRIHVRKTIIADGYDTECNCNVIILRSVIRM